MKPAAGLPVLPALLAASLLAILGPGCGGQEFMLPAPDPYLPNTSEANVIRNLVTACARRDIEAYAGLLADDFTLCFDEETKAQRPELPLCLSRDEDVACTAALFQSVASIRIEVDHGPALPANELGRDGQTVVDVSEMFIEVEEEADAERVTLRVDLAGIRLLYFRRGRSPVATAADDQVYIVDWREFGPDSHPGIPADPDPPGTWSGFKSKFCR